MFKKQSGLSSAEVAELKKEYGKNEIRERGNSTPVTLIVRQLRKNHILYLLFAAAVLSFFINEALTGVVIILVLITIIGITFIQEYKAERALDELKKMVVPITEVVRDGKQHEVESVNLVPGDIIVIRSGDRVPADCILIEEYGLKVDESILTGESKEKVKLVMSVPTVSPDENNTIFMGTFIVSGKALAKVIHTGMNTRFGKISGLITKTEKNLPLQDKVNKIAEFMVKIAFSIAIVTGGLILLNSHNFSASNVTHALVLMIAIAVSAFPEGLPVVMMTALAAGATRMAKKNAIVNRMSIIESLGETTVICTDKTGTITKGEMTVKKIISDGKIIDVSGTGYSEEGEFSLDGKPINVNADQQLTEIMHACVLCNNSVLSRTGYDHQCKVVGSATEAALGILAAKTGIYKEDIDFKNVIEIPFSSEKKTMFVSGDINGKRFVYAKGAPEYMVKHCRKIQLGSKIINLTSKERKKLISETNELTRQAFRTIALAYNPDPVDDPDSWHKNLIFLGIVGMEDPPREEVAEALAACKDSGIEVKMITGDNKETAISIAHQIGLSGNVIEGSQIDDLSGSELSSKVKEITIFARVNPEHKLRIVKALKRNGEVVTMTGDGVNDAPALKEADIGVAMGKNGTDVSRSVADLTLKDDNFATIVEAIKEGRTIFNNIRKFVTYQLSCNYSELLILLAGVIVSPLLGWEVPLILSLQILFMNLITDDLPAITLSLNHSSKDVMQEKPRRAAEILNRDLYMLIFGTGLIMALIVLLTYFISFNVLGYSVLTSRTIALVTLIVLEITNAFNFRSFRYPVLSRSPFVNKYLILASGISLLATCLILYSPLKKVFNTQPLGVKEWGFAIVLSFLFALFYDILKQKNNALKIFDFS